MTIIKRTDHVECFIQDGVAVFDGCFDDSLCDRIIEAHIEASKKEGMIHERGESAQRNFVNDKVLNLSSPYTHHAIIEEHEALVKEFNDIFWSGPYAKYADKYNILKLADRHGVSNYRVQRSEAGEGFISWHTARKDATQRGRLCSLQMYLNEPTEAGETEFLHLNLRVEAKKGRIIIFSSNHFYVHRGNPPLDSDKYTLNGWITIY